MTPTSAPTVASAPTSTPTSTLGVGVSLGLAPAMTSAGTSTSTSATTRASTSWTPRAYRTKGTSPVAVFVFLIAALVFAFGTAPSGAGYYFPRIFRMR